MKANKTVTTNTLKFINKNKKLINLNLISNIQQLKVNQM